MRFFPFLEYIRAGIMLISFMILVILASAIAVIYASHISRENFIELRRLEWQRDQLNEEWGRLLLEQSTWSGAARVKHQARIHLKMIVPIETMIVVIKP